MNDEVTSALHVLAACAAVIMVAWSCVALVRAVRRGGKTARGLGAALMLFGWGHMRDPRNDTVAEANQGQARRGSGAADGADDR